MDRWLTLKEAAQGLGISYLEIRVLVFDGKLKAVQVGPRGWRVLEAEIERYKQAQKETSVET